MLLLFTTTAFSELNSQTAERSVSEIRQWEEHADPLFVLGMRLLVIITILYIAAQIADEMPRRKVEAQNEKIESQQKQIENLLQEIQILKQERIVIP